MKRGKLQCHPRPPYGPGWHVKENIYDPSLRGAMVAQRTLNPLVGSSSLPGGTIWGYNSKVEQSAFNRSIPVRVRVALPYKNTFAAAGAGDTFYDYLRMCFYMVTQHNGRAPPSYGARCWFESSRYYQVLRVSASEVTLFSILRRY